MPTSDSAVSIHPYFKISDDKLEEARAMYEKFVAQTANEPGCLHYGFSFSDNDAFCRETYANAEGLLAHLDNVGTLLGEFLESYATLERLEIHGAKVELDKLREPLAHLSPKFFILECGFRN